MMSIINNIYPLAHRYLTFDQETRPTSNIKSDSHSSSSAWVKKAKKNLTSFDFSDFTHSKHLKSRISTPPLGALVFMMYLGLLVPRAKRAIERAPLKADGQKDHREFWDVMRRDLWGITFYIFGFKAINQGLAAWMEKRHGVKLTNSQKQVHSFSHHDINARLYSGADLQQHLQYGNRKALKQAANHNGYLGLPQWLQKTHPITFEKAKKLIISLRSALNQENHIEIQKSYDTLNELQQRFFKQVPNATKHWKPCNEFLSRYIQHKLVPLHAASFAMLFGFIGYGPVLFNTLWAKRQSNRTETSSQTTRLLNTQKVSQKFVHFTA